MATIVEMINPLTGLPEQVDKLDHTAQEIDDAVGLAPQLSNPNLLDNWYFGNPVDQRQGRVVKPNTTYYSDNTLATAAGTTSAYVTAYRYATGTANGVNYASFKLTDSDTAPTYYAAPENVVRGYTGSGYGIDRWITDIDAGVGITITDNGIVIASAGTYWGTRLDNIARLSGKTVTGSILMSNGTLYSGTIESVKWQMDAAQIIFSNTDMTLYISKVEDDKAQFEISTGRAGVEILAAKLELGSQQTLAHQDADGKWVLNEIPDYGEQLARCQRYFQTFATESLRPTNALDFRPVMWATPALSTITVGGKTLYTASADL